MTLDPRLLALDDEFFEVQNQADPFAATLLGISGVDRLVPDYSPDGVRRVVERLHDIERRVEELLPTLTSDDDVDDARVLARLAWGQRIEWEDAVWSANASAEGYASPPAQIFMCVPAVTLSHHTLEDYLARLGSLGGAIEAMVERYAEASRSGRVSTEVGLRRSVRQLRGHLSAELDEDLLASPRSDGTLSRAQRGECHRLVHDVVRPALTDLVEVLEDSLRGECRDDHHVGITHLPGGEEMYRRAVRRHTTTDLDPREIHEIGRERVARLREEFSRLGRSALGEGDVDRLFDRLRHDPALRFTSSAEIIDVAARALARAELARPTWFVDRDIAECVVEAINPIEAEHAAMAHYQPPAGDGTRPGIHYLGVTDPETRFRYEYEALSFHESSPGHHLQIATAQTLDLPTYRRYLDTQVCAFVEGWGLYAERLADEMGLYSSDLDRLGMLSFEALRACRLVVDTGMHSLGWSRAEAVDYMWANTATTRANVENEIDRYIGWPGQALAYLVGRREIERVRREAEDAWGERFDVRHFHEVVIGAGAVPLDVLDRRVRRWVEGR